ncbi:hypothetical protein ACFQVC_15240 [Streptomyces monticola]|uniref:Uncharacterized protein n=1 Tax=Streptomyces monticola TaxID=2666263 RepID=A0ABW2JJ76_9ACTN
MDYRSAVLLAAEHAEHIGLAAKEQGPGNVIRVVLVVSLLGAALLAWFLLRGYGKDADDDADA